jgi:hypothetical protein
MVGIKGSYIEGGGLMLGREKGEGGLGMIVGREHG